MAGWWALNEKVRGEIERIAAESNCELLAIEGEGAGRHATLRLVLDKEGGVTIEDCERVSRDVAPLLDAEADIPGSYELEVSSPGLDRRLYSPEDAARFVGRRVRVRTTVAVEGARNFRGRLASVISDRLSVVDEESRRTYNFSFGDIRSARLEVEWPDPARGKRKS